MPMYELWVMREDAWDAEGWREADVVPHAEEPVSVADEQFIVMEVVERPDEQGPLVRARAA